MGKSKPEGSSQSGAGLMQPCYMHPSPRSLRRLGAWTDSRGGASSAAPCPPRARLHSLKHACVEAGTSAFSQVQKNSALHSSRRTSRELPHGGAVSVKRLDPTSLAALIMHAQLLTCFLSGPIPDYGSLEQVAFVALSGSVLSPASLRKEVQCSHPSTQALSTSSASKLLF